MMIPYEHKVATYQPYAGRRYAHNPFIECLGLDDIEGETLDALFDIRPPIPTASDRKLRESVRRDEVNTLNDIVYNRPVYPKAMHGLVSNMKECYLPRNPMTVAARQHREHIARLTTKDMRLPSEFKSGARGMGLFGMSGTGKTTFALAASILFRFVIEHTSYEGHPIACRQVPWISVQIPHDATVKSFCLQFFQQVDSICGTSYEKEARSIGTVADMVLLISKVATAISLCVLFVDELQNLRVARSAQLEIVLNLFSQLIEWAGVMVVVAGTPAIESFASDNVRNIRKLCAGGEFRLLPMEYGSSEFDDFCDTYWPYQWTRTPPRALTKSIRKTWYSVSGGDPALMVLSYLLAQRISIGSSEVIDETSFERAYNTQMVLLQPAIRALVARDREKMLTFDDLIFLPKFCELRNLTGWTGGAEPGQRQEPANEELADFLLEPEHAKKPKAKKHTVTALPELPRERLILR